MTKKKVSAKLKKARALVNKGWCKGKLQTQTDTGYSYCAIGALLEVTKTDKDLDTFYVSAKKYLGKAFNLIDHPYFTGHTIEGYNDHPKTTKRDILDLYDVAIKLAQKDEVK